MPDDEPYQGQHLDLSADATDAAGAAADDETSSGAAEGAAVARGGGARRAALLAALAIVPAAVVGVAVWLVAGSGGGGGGGANSRVASNVTNVVNAFSQSQGSIATRYEGVLAPGYPNGVPAYPGATLISSELQISGANANYLAVYDTADARAKVTSFFSGKLNADPWQVTTGQDSGDSSLLQFGSSRDANLRGLLLATSSKRGDVTTVIVSVQIASGATAVPPQPYAPGASRPLPAGFPGAVPVYPGATVVNTAYHLASGSHAYALTLATKDTVAKVLDYYRQQLGAKQLTVADGDATQSTLAGAKVITFTDAAKALSGQVTAGALPEDASYVRVDIDVTTKP